MDDSQNKLLNQSSCGTNGDSLFFGALKQNDHIIIRSHLFIFVFISVTLGDRPRKTSVQFVSENALPVLSSGCTVSCLKSKSLSRFGLIFVYAVSVF